MQEDEEWKEKTPMLDKRTIVRIVDHGLLTGKLAQFSCLIPASKKGNMLPCEVICQAGADLTTDLELLKRVSAEYASLSVSPSA